MKERYIYDDLVCFHCQKEIVPGNNPETGYPNGIGFQLENGSIINICHDCLIKVGREIEGRNPEWLD